MTDQNTEMPVALVTGASSGIGAETARMLAERGYRVALAARRADKLEELGATLPGLEGQGWAAIPTDVGRADQIAEMVDETVHRFGRLDALVNNAGWVDLKPVARHDDELIRTLFEINAMGPVWAIARALPIMKKQAAASSSTSRPRARGPVPGAGRLRRR